MFIDSSDDGSDGSCTDTCQVESWKGDGSCDDANNNCGCEWDGGDCCGDDVLVDYCAVCECLDPNYWGNINVPAHIYLV